MSADQSTLHQVREFLRSEAIKSGNSDVYKAFLNRPTNAKVWPFNLNGDIVAVAITVDSKIEMFHVKKGEQGRRLMIANTILGNMANKGHVAAWVEETDPEMREIWVREGFKPKGRGLFTSLKEFQWPDYLERSKGAKKRVEVKFSNRLDGVDLSFAEISGVGYLTDQQTLWLPELAIAFDGLPEMNVSSRWVSVLIDGNLEVEAQFDTAKANELGLRRDAAGIHYIGVVDLYTPTIL